jgi:CHASE2 domain-containing sensor protein
MPLRCRRVRWASVPLLAAERRPTCESDDDVVIVAMDWNRQDDDNCGAQPMSRDAARQCVARMTHHLEEARAVLLELYEREGWRALGYDSWRACVVAAFSQSQTALYRQLTAARVERTISHNGKNGDPLPVLHALELEFAMG